MINSEFFVTAFIEGAAFFKINASGIIHQANSSGNRLYPWKIPLWILIIVIIIIMIVIVIIINLFHVDKSDDCNDLQ